MRHTVYVNSVKAHKTQLRQRIRAARSVRAEAEMAAAGGGLARASVVARCLSTTAVAAFLPVSTEPPVVPLLDAVEASGCAVYVPRVVDGSVRTLEWALRSGGVAWRTTSPKVPEPLGPAVEGSVWDWCEMMFLPALAVETTGARLGQGGGYYDAVLATKPDHALAVAVVFDDEVLDDDLIPCEPWDERVDAVLTPSAWLACHPPRPWDWERAGVPPLPQ